MGSLIVAAPGKKVNAGAASVWGMAGMGLMTFGLALTQTPVQMYILAALMGLANALSNMGIGVIFQKRVHPEYFGRVGSLLGTVSMVGMPLTLLALAPVADRIAVQTIFAVSGGLALVGAVVWAAILRREPLGVSAPAEGTAQVEGAA